MNTHLLTVHWCLTMYYMYTYYHIYKCFKNEHKESNGNARVFFLSVMPEESVDLEIIMIMSFTVMLYSQYSLKKEMNTHLLTVHWCLTTVCTHITKYINASKMSLKKVTHMQECFSWVSCQKNQFHISTSLKRNYQQHTYVPWIVWNTSMNNFFYPHE